MNFLRCEKNIAGDPVAIMGNSIGREIPYYSSDLKTLIIDCDETLTECNKAMKELKLFSGLATPANTIVGQTINHNGTDYEILSHDNNEIIFTDGKNVYSWNEQTGSGLQNTGNKPHKLCAGFNPKPYSIDVGLLNALNANKTTAHSKYAGRAFEIIISSLRTSTAYVFDTPANQGNPSYLECLILENNVLLRSQVLKDDIYAEIPVTYFLSQVKSIISFLLDKELSNLILKEF